MKPEELDELADEAAALARRCLGLSSQLREPVRHLEAAAGSLRNWANSRRDNVRSDEHKPKLNES